MPRFEDGCHSCANTSDLISKILAGKGEMKYTRAAVGSGIIPEGQTPRTLTEPPGYVMDGVLASVGNPVAGECVVQVQVPSSMVETSFKCTGVMLYALDPETEEEVPYTYLCLETESEEIRSRSNAVGKIAVFDIITVVGDVKNVSAVIDPNAMATHASVEAMFAQHLNRRDITIPTEGWRLVEEAPPVAAPPVVALAENGDEEGETPPADEEQTSVLYCVDIPIDDITGDCMADLKIARDDSQTAAVCGLSPQCESYDGVLRLYASSAPEKPMTGQLALIELSRRNGNGRMLGTISIAYTDASNIIYKGRPISVLLAGLEDLAETSRAIASVPTQLSVPTYDGTEHEVQLNGFDGAAMILSGTTKATDSGWYEAVITPKTGYYWMADGTATSRIIRWRIAGIPVPVPTQEGTLTYTGSPQSPTWAGVDVVPEDAITYGGDVEATNAGTYSTTASLAKNYDWADETQGDKLLPWTIGKAAGSLVLNKQRLELTIADMTGYIGVTRAGNGQISARSSDPSVADVNISGEQVAVTGKKTGSATITISVSDGPNHFAPASQTVEVSCTVPTSNPDEATAADIKGLVAAGLIDNYFDEGDNFPVTLVPQTIRGQAISGNYAIRYLETGHNAAREGANRSHFMFPVSPTDAKKNLAFCHTATLHNYVQMGQQGFYMNPATSTSSSSNDYYGTTEGGWRDSDMRTSLLPALLKCLPTDWQDIISPTTKYTSNGKRAANNTQAEVTATQDKLWLFSEFEVFGARTCANEYEKNFQTQYNHWKNGNDKRFYSHTNPASSVVTWLRSPHAGGADLFCVVSTGGGASYADASYSYGVCAGFTVAA